MGHIHFSWNVPLGMLNHTDIALEVLFPLAGSHRFRNLTSFITLYIPVVTSDVNSMLWDMEVRDRARYFGVLSGLIFEQNMYNLNMQPYTFTEDLRLIYPTLPFRYVYYAVDMTFVEHADIQLDVADDHDTDDDDSNDVVTEE